MMKNWIPMIILIVVCILGFIKVFLSKRESETVVPKLRGK